MKKYLISVLLSFTVVAGVTLSGCGENKQETVEETATTTTESTTTRESENAENAGTTESMEDISEVEKDSTEADTQEEPEKTPFESFTPIDTDECAVTINDAYLNEDGSYTVEMSMENKTADQELDFNIDATALNGVETEDPKFTSCPEAGSTEDRSLTIPSLKEIGIEDVTDVMLYFDIRKYGADGQPPLVEQAVHIYPDGEESAQKYERKNSDSDQVLVDNDQVSVTVMDIDPDGKDEWGEMDTCNIQLFLENKTDSLVMFEFQSVSINGSIIDEYDYGYYTRKVEGGDGAVYSISVPKDNIKAKGIGNIEKAGFTVLAHPYSTWDFEKNSNSSFYVQETVEADAK